MKSKVLLISVSAVLIATTTVSAALLPFLPVAPGPVTEATTWQDLPIVRVVFPDNLDIDVEAVYVIKNAEQWQAFWQSVPDVTVEGTATGELPYVDFEHNFAVIASYAWHEEGYAIDVTDAKFNGDQVFVQVDRQEPNPENCRPYFDPFYGGIAIIAQPDVEDFASTPVGASYQQVLEEEWDVPSRNC
ncbi:MAG TPA: hypothetical protein VGB42_07745 [Candidatus Thermoplasmatota archaeon]